MPKLATASVALSAIIFSALIPALEINATHLTNPQWPEHARLHEAWQILTNAALSLLALGCVWTTRAPRIGVSIALIICLSFLTAWAFGNTYGGSMLHTDGTQMAVGGLNIAVIVVLLVSTLLVSSLLIMKSGGRHHQSNNPYTAPTSKPESSREL